MNERWRIEVELTYDPISVSIPDFRETEMQALRRIRSALDWMIDKGEIKHYHILKLPEKCVEID